MYRLSRAHFESIGHKDARLDPLTLDFRGEAGEPLETVLWLRNMGGKTSTLALLFSVVQPDARRFLGREKAGEKREISRYVQPDDVAHVALEWWAPASGTIPGLGLDHRLITGQVLWYRRTQAAETERHFYSFRPVDGVLTLDDLPFRDGRRRIPGRAFLEWLTEMQRAHAELEVVIEDNQSAWGAHLENLGLDPTVFYYQLRMNEQEGGARKFLDFRDGDSFVDFLLDVVTEPATVNRVASTLGQVADRLAMKPQREREREFALGAAQRLRPIGEVWARLQESRRGHEALVAQGARLRARIASAVDAAASEQKVRGDEADGHHQVFAAAATERSRYERLERELTARAADLRLAEARQRLHAAEQAEAAALRLVEAWQAAGPLAQSREQQAAAAALDRILAEREADAAQERQAYQAAAALLLARLHGLADTALQEGRTAAIQAEEAAARFAKADQQVETATSGLAAIDADLRSIRTAADALEAFMAKLRQADVLQVAEPAEVGSERLRREDETCASRLMAIDQRKRVLGAARGQALQEQEELADPYARAQSELNEAAARHADIRKRVEALKSSDRLTELAEGEFELPGAARLLIERLLLARARIGRHIVDLRVSTLSDRRAKAGLAEQRLLPAELDVEQAVALLASRDLPATPGWHYLADRVPREQWPFVTARRPWLLPAVVVDPGRAEAAIGVLRDEAGIDPSGLLLVVESQSFYPTDVPTDPEGPGPQPAALPLITRTALYDREQAEAAEALLNARLSNADVQEADLLGRASAVERLISDLESLLRDCPVGFLEEMQDRIGRLEASCKDLMTRLVAARNRLEASSAAIVVLEEEQERLARRSRWLAAARVRADDAAQRERAAVEEASRERELRGRLGQLASERDAALQRRRQARESETDALGQAVKRQADGDRWRHEAARVVAPSMVVEDDGRPLEDLRADHEQTRRVYEDKTSRSQFAADRERVGLQVADLATRLSGFVPEVIEEAGRLLCSRGAETPEGRDDWVRRAQSGHHTAVVALIQAQGAVERAQQELALAPSDRRNMAQLPPEWVPEDLTDADAKLRVLGEQVVQAARQRDQAETAEKATRAAAQVAGQRHQLLQRDLDRLDDKLGPAIQLVIHGTADEPLSAEDARELVSTLVRDVESAGQAVASAQADVLQKVTELRRFTTRPQFEVLPEVARERFRLGSDEALASAALEQSEELERRAAFLERELATIAKDRAIVVDSLLNCVEAALFNVSEVQRLSIPDGLGEWSGQRYLRINFSKPDSVEEMRLRLEGLVEGLSARRAQIDGMELLRQAVRAVNRTDRFDVRVLKPNDSLKLERTSVSEFVAWSGGQKLTTAILIYCALVRLRALNRRGATGGDNVLILDNPIGEANLMTLVDLQLKVARALGVQLIFATGLNDLAVLSAFPNVIRLRNLSHASGKYVVPEEQLPGLRAARVWRRADGPSA